MAVKAGNYRGVDAEQRRAERRHSLLEATLDLWSRDGGSRLTMTRICAHAGLTERYFYESFEGLDAAKLAVMEAIATEISEQATLALGTTPGDPVVRVKAAIGSFVEILTSDPRKGRVAIVEAPGTDAVRKRRGELLDGFASFAAKEAASMFGHGREAENLLSATLFIGGVAELITAWLEGRVEASPGLIVETATRQFIAFARGDDSLNS